MVKLLERVPIDRQVRGFMNFFYRSIRAKLFIYLQGIFESVNISPGVFVVIITLNLHF